MSTEIKNAIIESAEISTGERGFLDCWLGLDYGGAGQGFGGYALYLPKSYEHHQVMSVAGHHLFRIMEIAGVTQWSKVKGQTIRVEASHSKVVRIGHIVRDDWYCPSEDFEAVKKVGAETDGQRTTDAAGWMNYCLEAERNLRGKLQLIDDLLKTLRMADLGLHAADVQGPCICSQCEFRRSADHILTLAKSIGL